MTLRSLEAAANFSTTQKHIMILGPPHKHFLCSRPMRTQRGPARSFVLHLAQELRNNLYHPFFYPISSYLNLQFNLFEENSNPYFNSLITHSVTHCAGKKSSNSVSHGAPRGVDMSGPFNMYSTSISMKIYE